MGVQTFILAAAFQKAVWLSLSLPNGHSKKDSVSCLFPGVKIRRRPSRNHLRGLHCRHLCCGGLRRFVRRRKQQGPPQRRRCWRKGGEKKGRVGPRDKNMANGAENLCFGHDVCSSVACVSLGAAQWSAHGGRRCTLLRQSEGDGSSNSWRSHGLGMPRASIPGGYKPSECPLSSRKGGTCGYPAAWLCCPGASCSGRAPPNWRSQGTSGSQPREQPMSITAGGSSRWAAAGGAADTAHCGPGSIDMSYVGSSSLGGRLCSWPRQVRVSRMLSGRFMVLACSWMCLAMKSLPHQEEGKSAP
mmetsp:Transcript_36252/g.86018  ORF Transcript_36252/g.86018 Transcript_36252/m.86018 type:complete len:301 (+) Transcript_36252:184-1086(+)